MTAEQFTELREQLEALLDAAQRNRMSEAEVWKLLDRTSALLDANEGEPGEATLRIIHSLLSTVWSNTRATEQLRRASA